MTCSVARAVVTVLALSAAIAAARAEDAPARPKPEPGVTSQSPCLSENSGWTRNGRRIAFTVALGNKCDARIRCRVFAYVTSAKGARQGEGVLTLRPGSPGQETKNSWSMRVPMAGGSAQTARECRAL